ncbi:MAG TPA: Ig domain-containing protein [Bacillus bacterium]|nr:Ig domain-containing protein [Bacillus sp. (in: firmicutes)]
MRFLKLSFVIPFIICSLILSSSTTIYAAPLSRLYSTEATANTYKAVLLTDIEKIIQGSMAKRENTVVIKYKGSTNKLLDVISGYISKAIEADEYLNYSYRNVNMSYKAYGKDVTITLKFSYYESALEMKYVDQKVKAILTKIIKPGMNDHEKVKAVHDYLVLNLAYDTRLMNNSPYSALTTGITACNGYAMLVYKMLKELDIEVRLISGTASSQAFNTQNHAWNMVKLDGYWYHLDATWDDPVPDESGRVLYDYYLLTDKEIAKNHDWKTGGVNGEEKPYPVASTSYFTLLQTKLATVNEANKYMELMNALELQYLLPEYTATNLTELSEMIKYQFANYKKDFSIRYTGKTNDLVSNLRQLIYKSAEEKKVRSWSFGSTPYIRGTTANDQLINIADIVYQ